MKNLILYAWAMMALVSCGASENVKVTVENPGSSARKSRTVEIAWPEVTRKIANADPEKIIVKDENGKEVASQIIYAGESVPQSIIFQTDIEANAQAQYTIQPGKRSPYDAKVYGRFVPERKDDFAWENDVMAFRMYGPALEATGEISNGIDIWVKKTQDLVIDKWYKEDDYHNDHGEGLDCYKVGRTLGAGAMAPYKNDSMYLGNNYTAYKILDQGPLRLTFELTYAPYAVYDGQTITEKRIISLDASNRFNKITEQYSAPVDVAAGITLRDGGSLLEKAEEGIIGYWEPENGANGHTGVGIVFDGKTGKTATVQNHLLGITSSDQDGNITYYMGAAWSKAGDVQDEQEWFRIIEDERNYLAAPLTVTVE